jgi:hypothetical protein
MHWTTFGLSLTAVFALTASAAMAPGCTPAETTGPLDAGSPAATGDSGPVVCADGAVGLSFAGSAGSPCTAQPGQLSNPACDDGNEATCNPTPQCKITASECGDPTTCEPFTNNAGLSVQSFRMRRLIISAPPALANPAVQNNIVTIGTDLNEPQCGEVRTGDFSWLLSFDMTNGTLTTGGAPPCDLTNTPDSGGDAPSCNPFTTGYCFVHKMVGSIPVAPATVPIAKQCDGTYATAAQAIHTLNIPIYMNGSIIVLPISGGTLAGVTISNDGNCIGKLNVDALNADCSDNYENCSKWLTAGSLGGFITLETADQVDVPLTNSTLCAQLTATQASTGAGITKCPRDANGNITAKGDFCSTTTPPAPGGCRDAFWLASTFAASAVLIDPTGTGQPDCQGSVDAGGD